MKQAPYSLQTGETKPPRGETWRLIVKNASVAPSQLPLLIIDDDLPRRLVKFHFVAHFLNELSLLFQFRFENLYFLLLRLNHAVLFEKFIEQHRVDRFIPDSVRLTFSITSYQVWIDLLHLLSYEAKLWDPIRIELALIVKRHWFQAKDRFARLIHRFDLILEAR